MIIQLNSDKNLVLHEEYRDKLNEQLSSELDRFSEYITRLEVHLSDENGAKFGMNDKRCLLEARQEGRQPVAVTEIAETYDMAITRAIDKLKVLLSTIQGRLFTKKYYGGGELLL